MDCPCNKMLLHYLLIHTSLRLAVQPDGHGEGEQHSTSGPLLLAWISNHMPSKVRDEITYPFPNFSEVWEWIRDFISLYNGCNYLSMLGLELIHVSKRGPWPQLYQTRSAWSMVQVKFTVKFTERRMDIRLSFRRSSLQRNPHYGIQREAQCAAMISHCAAANLQIFPLQDITRLWHSVILPWHIVLLAAGRCGSHGGEM